MSKSVEIPAPVETEEQKSAMNLRERFRKFAGDYFHPDRSQAATEEAEDARVQEEERENLLRGETLANALAGARSSYLPFLKARHRGVRMRKRQAVKDGNDDMLVFWSGYEECLQEVIAEVSGEPPLEE